MTFYQWAMTKRITSTPRGDFLLSMLGDDGARRVENTNTAWEQHLHGLEATEGERVAFRSLWVSYCNQCGDPGQQERVIAARSQMFFEMAVMK